MSEKVIMTDADVLSGNKGKYSINDHPGNKLLEKLVEKYYKEYDSTLTQFRHKTTSKIVRRIQEKGGRFLKITSDDKIEIQDDRAISGKVTKMLRRRIDKDERKRRRKQQKQQQDPDQQDNSGTPQRQKRPREDDDDDEDYDDDDEEDHPLRMNLSMDVDRFGLVLSPRSPGRMRINHLADTDTPTAGTPASSNSRRIWGNEDGSYHPLNSGVARNIYDYDSDNDSFDDNGHSTWQTFERNGERVEDDASWNANYKLLRDFYSMYGHTGVSTNWEGNPQLAEWATRQRQLFREVQSGYRIPTLREESRWKQLQLVNFPLNYERWHWERKYGQLKEILQGEKYSDDDDNATFKLPDDLKQWLDHQRKLMKDADGFLSGKMMDRDQVERLKCLGV